MLKRIAMAIGRPDLELAIARRFQLHDDIVAATGRAERPIDGPVLRTMSELAIETLPVALAAKGYAYPGSTARIVMTGPGGGDWTIAVTSNEAVAPVRHAASASATLLTFANSSSFVPSFDTAS